MKGWFPTSTVVLVTILQRPEQPAQSRKRFLLVTILRQLHAKEQLRAVRELSLAINLLD